MLIAKTASGLCIPVADQVEWWTFEEIFIDRPYEPFLNEIIKRSRYTHWHIMDMGCNAGYASMFFVDRLLREGIHNIKILGFDANKEQVDLYNHRFTAEQELLKFPNIKAIHGAMGLREGEVGFTIPNNYSPQGHLNIDEPNVKVPYVDWTKCPFEENILILKCDIEGSEQMFIETYKQELATRVLSAVFEFHEAEVDVESCRRTLKQLGFYRVTQSVRGNTSVEGFIRE